MPDSTDSQLDDAIRQNATGPAKASGDSGSMEQHRLSDQIAADRYLASKRAAKRQGFAARTTKLIPPGAA